MIKVGCCGYPTSAKGYHENFCVVELNKTFYQYPRINLLFLLISFCFHHVIWAKAISMAINHINAMAKGTIDFPLLWCSVFGSIG